MGSPKPSRRPSWKLCLLTLVGLHLLGGWFLSSSSFGQLTDTPMTLDANSTKSVYLGALETNLAAKWNKKYAETEQLTGTNLKMVKWARDQFEKFGFNATIDEYMALTSYPIKTSVSLQKEGTTVYEPSLAEDEVEKDPASKHHVAAFLGYSANGNVTADYVYCHYGSVEDFALLKKAGVDLTGKIAILRYGGIFRGLKVRHAQLAGAIGALIYSDPKDDGEMIVQNGYKAFPDGPARNPSAIQRGSSQFLSLLPGDPLSPGYARKPGDNSTTQDPSQYIPSIPVVPVSSKEITPILKKLSGHGTKFAKWDGLIDGFDYSTGPNPKYTVNVFNHQKFVDAVQHNIMAVLEGHNPHEVVLLGNHHDSWIPAAGDPHSGSTAVMEVARALGELVKLGWKPQRTIVIGSWDGEEYGLLGSTEFGEYFAKDLKKKVVAYLNTDVAVNGPMLQLPTTPLLYSVLRKAASQVDYKTNQTVLEHFETGDNKGEFSALGSGSDFTVFLEHLGIPSVDFSFGATSTSAVYPYHSTYDSYYWMKTFGDPGFHLHNVIAKFIGLTILELTESPVIALRTSEYPTKLAEYFNTISAGIPPEWLNSTLLGEGAAVPGCAHASADLTLGDLVDSINTKLTTLTEKSAEFDLSLAGLAEENKHWDDLNYWQKLKLLIRTKRANFRLIYYERHFLNDEGLKGRSWFKHIVYASGRYTGYAGQQLPALTEALEDLKKSEFISAALYFEKVLISL